MRFAIVGVVRRPHLPLVMTTPSFFTQTTTSTTTTRRKAKATKRL